MDSWPCPWCGHQVAIPSVVRREPTAGRPETVALVECGRCGSTSWLGSLWVRCQRCQKMNQYLTTRRLREEGIRPTCLDCNIPLRSPKWRHRAATLTALSLVALFAAMLLNLPKVIVAVLAGLSAVFFAVLIAQFIMWRRRGLA